METTNTDILHVANKIKKQIGHQALFMLGAQHLAADPVSLQFKIRGSKKVTHIKIKLEATDLYTMKFFKCRKAEFKIVNTETGVYFDMLNMMIEKNTGLHTSI